MGLLSRLFGKGGNSCSTKAGPQVRAGMWQMDVPGNTRQINFPVDVEVEEFFSQSELPPLLPDDRDYMVNMQLEAKRYDNEQELVRAHWTLAYLNHPDDAIVSRLLDSGLVPDHHKVSLELLSTMGTRPPAISRKAASVFWGFPEQDGNLRLFLRTVLHGNATHDNAVKSALLDQCPSDLKAECMGILADFE